VKTAGKLPLPAVQGWGAEHKHAPLAEVSIYNRVMTTTQSLFGKAINPHSLRAILATALADHSAPAAFDGSTQLGHKSWPTTEQYYVRAETL
jgi:integrase